MDVARSAPQGAHYHAYVIYLLPSLGIKKGARGFFYAELDLHQLGSRTAFYKHLARFNKSVIFMEQIHAVWVQLRGPKWPLCENNHFSFRV